MRKNLQQNKEAGFYLIYTIWLSLIIFTALITSISVYQHQLSTTHTLMELNRKETLIQMTRASFLKNGVENYPSKGDIKYTFPSGKVDLHYEKDLHGIWGLSMIIKTKKGSTFTAYYVLKE